MITKTIKLTSLFLNTENYRFEPLLSQKEAIEKMIDDQGEKLFNLANDIVTNGLSPVDSIMVTYAEDINKYIVLEGNRRITSLKLLNNPTLIGDENISLRKRFQKLQFEIKDVRSDLKTISCAVFKNPSDADIWIKRKHSGELNGIGTVTWNSQQKQRFAEKIEGKSSIPLQIISFLKSREDVSDNIKNALNRLSVTNLQRLIADPYIRENLGIEVNNGLLISKIDKGEVTKGLVKIIKDILDPQFKVSNIYNVEKRRKYIDSIGVDEKPDLTKEEYDQWDFQEPERKRDVISNNTTKKANRTSSSKKINTRSTLIPKSFNLDIENPKINKIFEELKHIQVKTCPNASSVLLRVFLELSIDVYIEKYDIIRDKALSACASKEPLNSKIAKVLNHMRSLGFMSDDLSKGIRTEIHDQNSVLSIESLNAYVHNSLFYPKADNLIIGWNNIETFFTLLWSAINKK